MKRIVLSILLLLAAPALGAEPENVDDYPQVASIFKKYCNGCHNAQDKEGDLVLESYTSLLAGGEHGAVVAAGKPQQSRLLLVLTGKAKPAMPPEDNERPGAAEIATLEKWIAGGAKGPQGVAPDPTVLVVPKVKPRGRPLDPVTALAASPDGQFWAVGRYGVVELLRCDDRRVAARLEGHRGRVTALSFSRDGALLAAAAGEPGLCGEVRLWKTVDHSLVRAIQGHQDNLYAAALSPDARLLATSSYDQQIKLWAVDSGRELRTLSGHNDAVFDLAFRPDGRVLASASGDRTVKLWDVAGGERLDTFSQPLKEQYAVAVSPDGNRAAAGGVDNRIRVWQLSADAKENSNPLAISRFAHEGAILELVYSPDGKHLASAADDRTVKIWSADALVERSSLERQPDWTPALAFAADGRTLAVGRLDGSVAVYEIETGKRVATAGGRAKLEGRGTSIGSVALAAAMMLVDNPPAQKAETQALSQRGVQSGVATRLQVLGKNLAAVSAVNTSHEKLAARLLEPPRGESVAIEVQPAADLPRGRYELSLAAPSGETRRLPIFVDDLPQALEREPNDAPAAAQAIAMPAGLWGTLSGKGDVDAWRFEARAGQTVVLDVAAASIGSKANCQLTLFDARGRMVAASNDFDDGPDPLLAYPVPADGAYAAVISDQTLDGGPEHFYRLSVGAFPLVAAVYPLSVAANQESEIELCGFNLPQPSTVRLRAGAGGELDVPIDPARYRSRRPLKVLVGALSESVEAEPNDLPSEATPIAVPSTVAGRIWARSGGSTESDLFRFQAKAGETLILETEAARRSSPVDTIVDVLFADGRPVERVWLQAVRDSYVTFRGIDTNTRDVRLFNWEEMTLNELIYTSGEVNKLFRAPRGPDSGFLLYEGEGGKRACYFDTTATVHALDEPCYVVTPHAPGTPLANNGLPVFRLPYANDDDGDRRLGSDSRLTFTAPADGAYLARVRDTRRHGGDRFAYRLTLRPARPDFQVALQGANPTVGAESGQTFTVTVDRIDGFDGPLRIDLAGTLPPGFSATTPLVIEAGHREARGVLFAAPGAPAPTPANQVHSTSSATATLDGREVTKPVGGLGKISLGAKPKVVVRLVPDGDAKEISIAPGTRTAAWLKIERAGFGGIVNLDVNNLPHGVIVDDIGLNNVQILEDQTERKIFFHCADWVPDSTRLVHAVASVEGNPASPHVPFHVRRGPAVAGSR